MEIRLKESELKEAVVLWIEDQGFSLEDKSVDIDFTAGRAPNGFSAEVETRNTPPTRPTGPIARTATVMEPAPEGPEPEANPEPEDSSPFLDDDEEVDGSQQALDLDLDG